tara:strand:+ start:7971 stop:8282 length:312 start_codon:yes stop_codon:yes gene_type:complete
MPSEIAKQIVNQIFGDEKASAMDSVNSALNTAAFDAVQAHKLEFAKQMGFELDNTAQSVADEIEDQISDGTNTEPEEVEVDERQPHEPPTDEQPEQETDETDS